MSAYEYGQGKLSKGSRVEIHPGCDLWMRGARFGVVTGFEASPCPEGDRVIVVVRMDNRRVRKPQRFTTDRVRLSEER